MKKTKLDGESKRFGGFSTLFFFQGDTKLGEVAKEDTFDAIRSFLESVVGVTVKDLVASEYWRKVVDARLHCGVQSHHERVAAVASGAVSSAAKR